MRSIKPYLRRTVVRSTTAIRHQVVFRFPRIAPGQSVTTDAFRARHHVTHGEIIVTQKRASGSRSLPVVRYQLVDASTGRAVTNSVIVTGSRTVVLPFVVPHGRFRLRITNRGRGSVSVRGTILVF